MKLTLTNEELQKAVTLYLQANAAVDVHGMDFVAKREGTIAEVEATVKDLPMVTVEAVTVEEHEPEETTEHIPTRVEEFDKVEDTPPFESDPEVLIDEESTIMKPQDGKATFQGDKETEEAIELYESELEAEVPVVDSTENQFTLNFDVHESKEDTPSPEPEVTTTPIASLLGLSN